jgi:lipopolysaccharide transport system ATP-binding protein
MDSIAISAHGLGKRYRIGEIQRYKALRDALTDAVRLPIERAASMIGRRPRNVEQHPRETIWAVRDVSFEVKHGEVIGIIGRNGAGKSTLLKILTRITEPTEGVAEVYGRVGSLLEVGTGFHPELTGRENVYLNGAILGMRRREIDRRFDEIVAFAETERFLDTPMKYYSSGMYVRLAFAVAAHLEPEVLLVDEVLAVGDTAFQQKCLGKMEAVARGGRTILFVSHQLNQIRRLCTSCLWLDAGRVRLQGPTADVVSAYEGATLMGSRSNRGQNRPEADMPGSQFLSWEIVEPRSERPNVLTTTERCVLTFTVQVAKPIHHGLHGITLRNHEGQMMWGWATFNLRLAAGRHEMRYTLPSLPLRPGVYHWQVSLWEDGSMLDNWHCVPEMVIATPPLTHPRDEWTGILNIPCDFAIMSAE